MNKKLETPWSRAISTALNTGPLLPKTAVVVYSTVECCAEAEMKSEEGNTMNHKERGCCIIHPSWSQSLRKNKHTNEREDGVSNHFKSLPIHTRAHSSLDRSELLKTPCVNVKNENNLEPSPNMQKSTLRI